MGKNIVDIKYRWKHDCMLDDSIRQKSSKINNNMG
jgi:hypothetical protein